MLAFKILCLVAICMAGVTIPIAHTPHRHTPSAKAPTVGTTAKSFRAGVPIWMNGGYLTLGAYFVNISVGAADQEFMVLVDTGSSNTAVPAVGCINCGSETPLYDPLYSTFAQEVMLNTAECQWCNPMPNTDSCVFGAPFSYPDSGNQCGFGITYGGGSSMLAGVLSVDQICIDELCVKGMFGQIKNQVLFTGNFNNPGAFYGIFGLASTLNSCNPTCVPTIMDLFVEQNQISNNTFGICIGMNGGMLDVGYYDESKYVGELQWIANPTETWFTLNVLDAQLGTTSFGLPPFMYASTNDVIGTFVDSGTSIIIMGPAVFATFQGLYQSLYASLPGVTGTSNLFNGGCIDQSSVTPSAYPVINVIVQGITGKNVTLTIYPESYLLPVGDQYCLGVAPTPSIGMVLGDVFMSNYYIAHDRTTRTMGFAPQSSNGCGPSNKAK